MRVVYALAFGVACGRLGFDPTPAAQVGDARAADGAADAPAAATLTSVAAPGYGSAASEADDLEVAAGDFLVAVAYWDETPDTVTLTDTAGLAWSAGPSEVIGSDCGGGSGGNATGAQLYFASVARAGSDVVAVTQTSGIQPLGVFVLDYRGIDGVDATASAIAPSASTAMVAPPITATHAGVIVAFFGDTIGAGTLATGSGYTALARDVGFPNLVEGATTAAGDQYVPTATLPNGPDACWVVLEAVLRVP